MQQTVFYILASSCINELSINVSVNELLRGIYFTSRTGYIFGHDISCFNIILETLVVAMLDLFLHLIKHIDKA